MISGLYGKDAVTFLGEQATEERAMEVSGAARVLHFAVHGLLNEHAPLDSALALSVPEDWREGSDNGLLQAWEIFERVRMHADLVTLSACESALGKDMEGEGLIGLTRAFQYAGARSVLASLWKVSDRSTVPLMARFYSCYAAGRPKDEALRAAQLDTLYGRVTGPAAARSGSTGSPCRAGEEETLDEAVASELTSPYHWAAFQLIGDWK